MCAPGAVQVAMIRSELGRRMRECFGLSGESLEHGVPRADAAGAAQRAPAPN